MDALRLLLLLALAGSAVTFGASALSWWMNEERRLTRLMARVLGGPPDAMVIAPGRNAAAAFGLESGKVAVMREGGRWTVVYPVSALEGAELLIDDAVAARAWRGEPRRALDAVNRGAREVALRLVFDNAKDPDFTLDLWLPEDAARRADLGPGAAIAEGRAWLARAEALMRTPRGEPVVRPRDEPPWEED